MHNEVLKVDAISTKGRVESGIDATRIVEGQQIGSFYLLQMDGIFQNASEVLLSAYQGNNIRPGDVKFKDQNEDGRIDNKDRVDLGSAIPKMTFGVNLAAHYKNFDVSLFLQGTYGSKIYSQINQDIEGFYRGFPVTQRYFDQRWTGEGTSNTQPRASWSAKANNAMSDYPTLFFGSHDMPRLMNRLADGNPERAKALAALMLTARGVPFVYYGEEIGMQNIVANTYAEMVDIQGKTHYLMALHNGMTPTEALVEGNKYNRDKSRSPMQWDTTRNAGFSMGEPWIKVQEDYKNVNVQECLQQNESILSTYKKLITMRNSEPALQLGNYERLEHIDDMIISPVALFTKCILRWALLRPAIAW